MTVLSIPTPDEIPLMRALMREYVREIQVDLCFQGFEEELQRLPGAYGPPEGILLLARVDGVVAGCVAGHRWEAGVCEMKRLYVRPAFRGTGCGRTLVLALIAWSEQAGYSRILLDTLSSMDAAIGLYRSVGFYEIGPYRPNPLPGPRYFARDFLPETRGAGLDGARSGSRTTGEAGTGPTP